MAAETDMIEVEKYTFSWHPTKGSAVRIKKEGQEWDKDHRDWIYINAEQMVALATMLALDVKVYADGIGTVRTDEVIKKKKT